MKIYSLNQSLFSILLFLMASSGIFAQTEPLKITNPELVGLSSDSLEVMNTYFHNLVDN